MEPVTLLLLHSATPLPCTESLRPFQCILYWTQWPNYSPCHVLHWSPLSFRFDFKILFITFKACHGSASGYIAGFLLPNQKCSLGSWGRALLALPESRHKPKGDWAVTVGTPPLWHTLPESLWLAGSATNFKWLLKTHLLKKAFLKFQLNILFPTFLTCAIAVAGDLFRLIILIVLFYFTHSLWSSFGF